MNLSKFPDGRRLIVSTDFGPHWIVPRHLIALIALLVKSSNDPLAYSHLREWPALPTLHTLRMEASAKINLYLFPASDFLLRFSFPPLKPHLLIFRK